MGAASMESGPFDLMRRLEWAYLEDCPELDYTSHYLVPDGVLATARIVSKSTGVFSGRNVVEGCQRLFPELHWEWKVAEGDCLAVGTELGSITGDMRLLLRLERVMLNLLGHLSGIATSTRELVNALNDPHIRVLDTRKTMPLWRDMQRLAVCAGGGANHRLNLSDAILIKENHLAAHAESGKGLQESLQQIRLNHPQMWVEIEIESMAQATTFPFEWVDCILLDNMGIEVIEGVVAQIRSRGVMVPIEVSGNITCDTIGFYRGLPIQRISVGWITHSAPNFDLSMRMVTK